MPRQLERGFRLFFENPDEFWGRASSSSDAAEKEED